MFLSKFFNKTKNFTSKTTIKVYTDLDSVDPGDVSSIVKGVLRNNGFSIVDMDVESIGAISANPITKEKIRVHGRYAKVNTVLHVFTVSKTTTYTKKDIKVLGDRLFDDEAKKVDMMLDEIRYELLGASEKFYEVSFSEYSGSLEK